MRRVFYVGIKVGVIGTGKLGRQHVRVLKSIPEVDHVACYDILGERSQEVAGQFGAESFDDARGMLESVDAVSVVVPTVSHTEVSLLAIECGNNVFLEKPIAASVDQAKEIIRAARESKRILQIGHIERFNSAVREAHPHVGNPSFIEIHRLAPFNVRGIDVSVIMDLMIHDIDLLSWFIGKRPVDIRATGAAVLTKAPDIVNARVEYDDGCVANLTASRVSIKPMRKVRIFTGESYLSVDLLKGEFRRFKKGEKFDETVARLKSDDLNPAAVSLTDILEMEAKKGDGEEPLFRELRSFCRTVSGGETPEVTGEDGLTALEIATEIQNRVESSR